MESPQWLPIPQEVGDSGEEIWILNASVQSVYFEREVAEEGESGGEFSELIGYVAVYVAAETEGL